MKIARSLSLWMFLTGLIASFAASAGAEETLFNGRNLDGWKGDPRLWSVVDGVLTGQTDTGERSLERNSFLIWQGGEVGDFELTLSARVTGGNNSGVQYRARVVDPENFVLHGYQMDLHPRQDYTAMLYEEGGRGIVCLRGQAVTIAADGDRAVEALDEGVPETDLAEWNDYRIVAKGDTVTHWVNGTLAAKITDREVGKYRRSGALGLQLHAGPAMKAEFKDIVLKRLSSEETSEANAGSAANADPIVKWIWSRESPRDNEEIFLRGAVEAPENVEKAVVIVTCDNRHELFLNGTSLGSSDDWETPAIYDVTAAFVEGGRQEFLAWAANEEGSAGFAFRLQLTLASGEKHVAVSDEHWEWSSERGEGAKWAPVTVIAALGAQPWGEVFEGWTGATSQPVEDVTADYDVLPGFKLERIYEVPKFQGSWVAMTVDDEGRILASDQYGGIFRMTLPAVGDADAVAEVERLNVPIEGAQGLLWAHDALYAVVSIEDPAVYRITDSDGDGQLDHAQKIKQLGGGGEHGPHGLVLSPDGTWIYMVSGNHTRPPEVDASLVPAVWEEDQLLPRRPDARGHARDIMAPGGWVARFTPDGDRWELVSTGYRNAYDIAFDEYGELFTWDSDMEWDMGTPWYRPTRICHITSGSEFGWRNGTGKWPLYYEDSLPAILNIGPGSPTGVLAGRGLEFPARYQRAMFMLDWTYATMYAVHLTPDGASYTAETEEVVAGSGLPMTDAVAGPDGALYFAVGGRRVNSAVFRLSYIGDESTDPVTEAAPIDPAAEKLANLRRDLEELHENPDPAALDTIWRELDHEDRFIRFAARVALEHLPASAWKARLNDRTNSPWQTILAAMALARTGTDADQAVALGALDRVDAAALEEQPHLNLLRAYGLIFIRHGEPDEARREQLIEEFGVLYPSNSDNLNRELCRMLAYLESPEVLPKTLRLMATATASKAPQWAELAARNDTYGSSVTAMIENMPSEQNLFYAYCLRTLDGPWTVGQRRQFFTWLAEASQKSGGSSYRGFIADLREETLKRATPEEREMIEGWDLAPDQNPFANLPSVEGPGRAWTVEEAVAAAEKGLVGRDLANGRRMFHATLCASCHRFEGQGGSTGPDLTAVGNRFAVADLVEAIIHPNQAISDQYVFDLITLKDGSALTGKIVEEKNGTLVVGMSPFDFTQTREIPRESVESIEPSPVSPMPAGLINRLNEDELRDLLAYLIRGNDHS